MTFLSFAPASTKWLGRKDRKSRRDFVTFIAFPLRVISDILLSSCFESYGPKDTRYKAQIKL